MSARAVVFLDLDGTCHPVHCPVNQLFNRLPLLEDWLRVHRHVDVVISSSWREHHPLDELQSFFADDLQSRVIDVTPVLTASRYEREDEILEWLRSCGAPWRPWVAFDDQAALFHPFSKHLVLCNPKTGLTSRELICAASVLENQK